MIFLRYKENTTPELKIPVVKKGAPSKFMITHSSTMQQWIFDINSYSEEHGQMVFKIHFETSPFAGQYNYALFSGTKKIAEGLMNIQLVGQENTPSVAGDDFYFDYDQNEASKKEINLTEEQIEEIVRRAAALGKDAWIGSLEEYESLSEKDDNTWYYITDDDFVSWDRITNIPKVYLKNSDEYVEMKKVNSQYIMDITPLNFAKSSIEWDEYYI